jgi:hypothetical protein
MEKKEFPKKGSPKREFPKITEGPRSKISGISDRAFGIIKFVLGICLLPFVYSVSVSFLHELALVDRISQGYFWAGIITFLIVHLFVFEPEVIYRNGHRLLEIIFSFFAPLVKVAPFVLPVYAIVIFILYLLLSLIFQSKGFFYFFLFIFSFSLSLHLVFSAKSVRSRQNDFLKANYIFGFSFIYLVNLILLSLCLGLVFKEFSFVNFFNNSFLSGENIFYAVFKQLFL